MGLFKHSSIPCRVISVDTELEFQLGYNATGKELFDMVVKTIGLRETWYFGLQYCDNKGFKAWLDNSEKVMSQDIAKVKYSKENRLKFELKVKYYPEDVEEIIQDATLRAFYLQVRDAILSDEIYCPPESSVVLAAYVLQAQFGNYQSDKNIQPQLLLPARVIRQHHLSTEEWADRIGTWWQSLLDSSSDDVMREYLKLAQDLEMFGVNYFDVTNKKGTELLVGIDAHGLSVYEQSDKLTPKIGFPWSEIRTVSYEAKKFLIKPVDKKSPTFVIYVPRCRFARRMLLLASGNHEFYIARRKPDGIEIQQMKAQAAEEKAMKQRERQRLQREIEARQMVEAEHHRLEEQLKRLTEEAQEKVANWSLAQEKIKSLEEQLQDVRLAKNKLEQQHVELEQLNVKLAESSRMEAEERAKLAEEVAIKQEAYNKAMEELQAKDKQTKQLKAASKVKFQDQLTDEDTASEMSDREQQHEVQLMSASGDDSDGEILPRPEEAKVTHLSQVKTMQQQLKELSDDLAKNADKTHVTTNDQLHRENVRLGRDKYKTLKDIRKGNTLRRVDYFENM